MPMLWDGKTVEHVAADKLTPGEIDAVERVTGLTFQKIRRMGDTCVCEHGLNAHRHVDAATGEQDVEDTSCTSCDCPEHDSDMPMRVITAFSWVSVKRAFPAVTFAQFSDVPPGDLQVPDAAPEPDPLADPPAAA